MIHGTRNNAWLFRGLVVFISCLIFIGGTLAVCASEPSKILILPFRVVSDTEEKELRSFSVHADQRIRSTIGQLGERIVGDHEQTAVRLVRGKPAPWTDEEAKALAKKFDADLVVYGAIANEGSRYRLKGVMWDMRSGPRQCGNGCEGRQYSRASRSAPGLHQVHYHATAR